MKKQEHLQELIWSLCDTPMSSQSVRKIAETLIKEGWRRTDVKQEPNDNSKEYLMNLLGGHSIDTEKDV